MEGSTIRYDLDVILSLIYEQKLLSLVTLLKLLKHLKMQGPNSLYDNNYLFLGREIYILLKIYSITMHTDNYFNFSSSLYVICCENHNFNSLILILVHMWESKYTRILRVRESKTENVKEKAYNRRPHRGQMGRVSVLENLRQLAIIIYSIYYSISICIFNKWLTIK